MEKKQEEIGLVKGNVPGLRGRMSRDDKSDYVNTDSIVLGESFKFLLNKEDDVYDTKYEYLLEAEERRNIHHES
ncbi:hypothetical protein [Sulfoacidibacillus ferrooxidans]|uniref:hypothetical protein n=1 Tax=Sulfoacidibacillus ferrooxidans TaxID=2005001 RepID=UPI001F513D0A|nr:hypothetical protein [Sulfoacidibacillus ferrooxidans]